MIPPGSDIGILNRQFSLFPRPKSSPRPHMAIDFFFRALAADCGSQAIGIILSGTATDGTEGLRSIKAENGVTLAQEPSTAKFSGMPQSAVNAEVVDYILPIEKIVDELVRLSRHPYVSEKLLEPFSSSKDLSSLQKVFVLLKTATGIDFTEYKSATIKRRLNRRMALVRIDTLEDYIKFLQDTPEELKSLSLDIFIHVTSFFRDQEVYEKLKTEIFPQIIKRKSSEAPIRVWVAGCSSGEEVYSIAISLLEFLGSNSSHIAIQIFGSDISERMIEKARMGFYPESQVRDVDAERLRRFFVKTEGGYRINKLVRNMCVFVRHDLARDPPFSKLDLITCRNVLIYFEAPLQKRIISTFHYCLNQPGFLLLGRAESVAGFDHLFSEINKTDKIYSRESVTSQLSFASMQSTPAIKQKYEPFVMETRNPTTDIGKQIDHLLLSQYAPAGVVVNEKFEVLQYRGQTGTYLEHPPGQPQINLLKMIREGLFATLKMALSQAKKKKRVINCNYWKR